MGSLVGCVFLIIVSTIFLGQESFLTMFINFVKKESCPNEDDSELPYVCSFVDILDEFMTVVSVLGIVGAILFVCCLPFSSVSVIFISLNLNSL